MTERTLLPQRRASETFSLSFAGLNSAFTVTVGFYDGGRLGEVFINGGKSGEQVEAVARDGAVLLSLALQHGVGLETIAKAVTRDGQGAPSSIVGAVVDCLTQRDEAARSVTMTNAPRETGARDE